MLPGHCTDAPPFFQEDITFASANRYDLVVPHTTEEGSHDLARSGLL